METKTTHKIISKVKNGVSGFFKNTLTSAIYGSTAKIKAKNILLIKLTVIFISTPFEALQHFLYDMYLDTYQTLQNQLFYILFQA